MAPQKPTKKSPNKPADKPGSAVAELLATLDLEQLGGEPVPGPQPAARLAAVFGGQVLGQALVAAVRTVAPERVAHSLHAYFLLPRRSGAADHLQRRARARRRQLHHPARHGDPARPADLRDELLVPDRRARPRPPGADAAGAAARGACRASSELKAKMLAQLPENMRKLLGARAAHRACARWTSSRYFDAREARPRAERLDARERAAARTHPACTSACWPMPPTSRCSTRRSSPTAS